ncbi:MAG: anti-sigma factor [Catenulispora sp.]|nr:anti-sigma factor [Catenulispora sp.]
MVLVALEGRLADDVADHLRTCAACRTEVDANRAVAGIAREAASVENLPPAPERVWQAIAGEVFDRPQTLTLTRPARRAWWRQWIGWRTGLVGALAASIAVVITLVAVRGPQAPAVVASATLAVQNPAAADATGRAELLSTGQLRVTLTGMPQPDGYYEVWLYDGHDRMIGLGDAGSGNQTVLIRVPASANAADFPIVDISAQHLGQQEHGQSMLQGRFGP